MLMHEYAYYGRGNAIHSPCQIEWFHNTCDIKSYHVGGKHVITFLDGATLLECRTGLMYMSNLGKNTDHDLDQLLCVLLTSPHEWDPSWAPDSSVRNQHDPMIDECGNIQSQVIHTLSFLSDTPITIQKHVLHPTTIHYNEL